jgi:serine/threonine protein kinase/Tfp pilus assembly protein PilF
MEREQRQAVEEAFSRVAELDGDARRREIDALRQHQPEVASEVESLLAAQANAGSFLSAGWQKPPNDGAIMLVGRAIGPYQVLAVLGEGGMGAVYLAEQFVPLKRRVALKVIKAGFDSRQVVARFESERQTVAMMDHANIAKVFDAGVSDLGRPYFVMEYVEGVRITEYCDAQRLSVLDRVRLVTAVCGAVQHAHQKGIIHRDLKPSNVLVAVQDGVPVPKVIDFGIAKVIHQRPTDDTLHTELGTTMGTPGYMSPEQAERGSFDIDTRTDVYSLGALLYELLVGVLPFDAAELRLAGPVGATRILRDNEPPAPSARLAMLGAAAADHAACRSTDVDGLRRQLRGDLDRIVLKALDPDRERRYETARDLSLDLMRHLNDEPVLARTPSVSYRARKFARRHRAGVIAGAVATIALAAGLAGTTQGLLEANRQREVASAQAAKAEAINGFLTNMLSAADPGRNGRDVRVVDVLDRAADGVDKDFAAQPEIAASIRQTLGETMVALGQYQKAEAQFTSALDIRRRVLGETNVSTLTSMDGLAESLYYQDQVQKAVAVFEQSWKTKTRTLGPDHPDTLETAGNLAGIISELGRHAEAESMYRSVLAASLRHPELESTVTQGTLNNLALVLKRQKKLDEAADLYTRAFEIQRRALGEENPLTLNTQHNLAMLYTESGKSAAAEALHRVVLAKKRKVFGDAHPQTFASWNGLAEALCREQRYDEGVTTYVDLLEHGRTALGEKSRLMAVYRRHYGACLTNKGDYPAAEGQLTQALAAMSRISPTHLDTQNTLIELIRLDEAWGRPQRAAAYRAQLDAARTPAKAPSSK